MQKNYMAFSMFHVTFFIVLLIQTEVLHKKGADQTAVSASFTMCKVVM
ncbi:hypothetical protein [Clostridium boliviensis]|nr:hypothetical protein [Clostridium boliviensis]